MLSRYVFLSIVPFLPPCVCVCVCVCVFMETVNIVIIWLIFFVFSFLVVHRTDPVVQVDASRFVALSVRLSFTIAKR